MTQKLLLKTILFILILCFLVIGCKRRDKEAALVNAGSKEETLTIINQGADVNGKSRSHFGWTPLISAIYHDDMQKVDILLDHGADVNLWDDQHETPIYLAVAFEASTNLMYELVKRGADPRIKDSYGNDAFSMAETKSNTAEIVEILKLASKK
jgi:ankyrin repeat protein